MNSPPPATPARAAGRRAPIDRLLDPGLFRALGDPTRVRLVACLAKCARGCTVGEIAACCSVDLSVVSRHLALLERAGVVTHERRGRASVYTVRYAELAERFDGLAAALVGYGRQAGACCETGCCPEE